MQIQPMIVIDKSGLTITPEGFDAIQAYAQHYIRSCGTKLEEYHTEIVNTRGSLPSASTPEGTLIASAQHEINRAKELTRQIDQAKREMNRMFLWHFEKEADVYRKTRMQLGLTKTEDDSTLYIVVQNVMEMLHKENQFFNREKFINYINQGGETHA